MKRIIPLIFLLPLMIVATARSEEDTFISTSSIQICSIPLPVSRSIIVNSLMLNTKHVYVKIDGKTYGTPFTTKKTYLWGDAYLYSEDILFQQTKGKAEKCYDIKYKESESEDAFIKKASCIADKLSRHIKTNPLTEKKWLPVFDYHFLNNNCGSMANYLIQCFGGRNSKTFNYSVGDNPSNTKEAKIIQLDQDGNIQTKISSYGEICQKANTECDEERGILLTEMEE